MKEWRGGEWWEWWVDGTNGTYSSQALYIAYQFHKAFPPWTLILPQDLLRRVYSPCLLSMGYYAPHYGMGALTPLSDSAIHPSVCLFVRPSVRLSHTRSSITVHFRAMVVIYAINRKPLLKVEPTGLNVRLRKGNIFIFVSSNLGEKFEFKKW